MMDFSPGFTEKYAFFKDAAFTKALGNFFAKEITPRANAIGNAFGTGMVSGAGIGAGLGGAMGVGASLLNGDSFAGTLGTGIIGAGMGAGMGGAATPFLTHGAQGVGSKYRSALLQYARNNRPKMPPSTTP